MFEKIMWTMLIVVIMLLVYVITNFIFKRFVKGRANKRNETIFLLILNVIKYLGLVVGIFSIFYIFGVDTNSVLAGAGLLGILLGFGMQKLMQDMINGFFIIFENQYMVGEYVGINGIMGEVLELGLKTTKILSYEGEYHFFANGDITTVVNYSRFPSLAIIDVPVAHANDLEKVYIILNKVIEEYHNRNIKSKPMVMGVQEITEFYYSVRVICQTKSFEQFGVMRDLRSRIEEAFYENGLKFLDSVYIKNRNV